MELHTNAIHSENKFVSLILAECQKKPNTKHLQVKLSYESPNGRATMTRWPSSKDLEEACKAVVLKPGSSFNPIPGTLLSICLSWSTMVDHRNPQI